MKTERRESLFTVADKSSHAHMYPVKPEYNLSKTFTVPFVFLTSQYLCSFLISKYKRTNIHSSFFHVQAETAARLKTIAQSCHFPPPSASVSLLLPSAFFFLLPLKSQARITSKSKHMLTTSQSHLYTQTTHKCSRRHTKTKTHTHLVRLGKVPQLAEVNGVEQVSIAAL